MSRDCRCGRLTRDAAYVCESCLSSLARALGEVPWLEAELETTITRQHALPLEGGAAANSGLPWHEAASEARRHLRVLLVSWTLFVTEERIRSSREVAFPVDTLAAMSRYLLCHTEGLAWHDIGPDAVEEITDAVEQCRRIVFWKPANRVFLGRCDAPDCAGDVYADDLADDYGACETCQRPHPVEAKREEIEAELDSHLYTAAELAELAVYLQLRVDREKVRKIINLWHHRGRLIPGGHDEDGEPRFRYGQVKPMLMATYAEREPA